MERVLVDTNVMIVGAKDYADDKGTPESEILKMVMGDELEIVLNPILLEEYHRVARDIVDKDFAGWFRNVVMKDFSITYVDETKIRGLTQEFRGEIPSEDLPHFGSCLLTDTDFLISENREFLKRSEGHGFKCVTPEKFLEELEDPDEL